MDVDPFDEHGKTDEATGGEDETIPFIPMGGGDSQIDPSGEQETSFGGGAILRTPDLEKQVKGLYEKLAKDLNQNPRYIHYDLFEIKGKDLYFRDLDKPLTTRGRLKTILTIGDILGKKRTHQVGVCY